MKGDLSGKAKGIDVILLIVGIVIIMGAKVFGIEELKLGFYSQTCPLTEHIVRTTVAKAVATDPGMAAGLIRMHFHDCIVLGCDASILLDKTTENPDSEKDDNFANPLLRGFEIIDDAKSKLEFHCPQTVSCADILAFAARDSVAAAGHFTYAVPAGRRDSLVSHGANVSDNVPFPTDIIVLKRHFEQRGLSLTDMVALSGAHSIGIAPCNAFSDRLYFFNDVINATDPSLDPKFAAFLKEKCPLHTQMNKVTVDLDNVTPNRLDVQFYDNLKRKMGVLSSDQALETDPLTASTVRRYRRDRAAWMTDFSKAMVKMGKLKVLTGTQGEIRRNCHFKN